VNDAGQVLRRYLTIVRRQWWVILQAAVVVGLVAAFVSSRADDPPYRASTTLLLQEDTSAGNRPQKADVLLAKRNRELTDQAVLTAAAKAVPGESPATIAAAISSTPNTAAGTINITVTTPEPERPVAIANAVADAYLADQRAKLTASARASLAEAESRKTTLEKALVELPGGPFSGSSGGSTASFNPANAQREAIIAQLTQIYLTIENLKVQIDSANPRAEVLFPAVGASPVPRTPPWKSGAQGAAAGLIVGLGLAALREALDTRLRDREVAERELPWPVLAELPDLNDKNAKPLAMHDLPSGPVAESMRRLRTNIRFLGGDKPIRCVVVTSPQPADGKTFVAANLAIAYAQLGMRTLLVSGDLRRPSLDSYFVAKSGPGLCDLLLIPDPDDEDQDTRRIPEERVAPESVIRFTGVPNLWLLPSGGTPPNPAELLASPYAAETFADLRKLADVVVIDAPPTVVVDPVLLGGQADGIIVVASVGKTQRSTTRHARHTLEASNERVLGVVLNRMRSHSSEYGYGAYTYDYSSKGAADEAGVRRGLGRLWGRAS
jgi:capsular exopolysaccharide synthesis family protein